MNRRGFSVLLLLVIAAFSLATHAAARDKAPAGQAPIQAVLLDHNEFLCSNCLFGNSDYYFCFDADDHILIGHEKVRSQTWKRGPEDLLERGKTVPLRYDDRYIWVTRPDGKDAKLTQDYTKKIFLNNDRCQAAIKAPDRAPVK